MSDCEHYGKTNDELDAELGTEGTRNWILNHCSPCPVVHRMACRKAAKEW